MMILERYDYFNIKENGSYMPPLVNVLSIKIRIEIYKQEIIKLQICCTKKTTGI